MGHDIFEYRGHSAIINDLDIAAVQHFLLAASASADFDEMAAYVRKWNWAGPGVWIGIDGLEALLHADASLERRFCSVVAVARNRVRDFGAHVPRPYLDEHVVLPGVIWGDIPTTVVLGALDALTGLICGRR